MLERCCPICKSEIKTLIFHDINRRESLDISADFVKCKECGMRYLTNIPTFDDFKDVYTDIYSPELFACPKKGQSNGKRILDIGCNFGRQLKPYYTKGYEVFGIDLNPKAVDDIKRNLPEGTFSCVTIEEASFPNEYFDIIRTSHVLEHVYDLDAFVKKVYSLLKSGGEFIIKVPNGGSMELKVFGRYASQSWIPLHINMFSGRHICRLLKHHGFSSAYTITKPMPWWWILSWRQYKNRKSRNYKVTFDQSIVTKIIRVLLFPLLLPLALLCLSDELIVIGKKR